MSGVKRKDVGAFLSPATHFLVSKEEESRKHRHEKGMGTQRRGIDKVSIQPGSSDALLKGYNSSKICFDMDIQSIEAPAYFILPLAIMGMHIPAARGMKAI